MTMIPAWIWETSFHIPGIKVAVKNPASLSLVFSSIFSCNFCQCQLAKNIFFTLYTTKLYNHETSVNQYKNVLFPVNIKRPPSAAQHGVYTASCRGPPTQANTAMKPRPFSAKARITTERVAEKITSVPKTRPPWRPFSGHAALGRQTPLINKNPDNANAMMKEELHFDLPSLPKVYQDRYMCM